MKILLVEDDEPTATLLSEALIAQHYTIDLATDGQMGLEIATAWNFDLILLDVLIPKLDGLSLCRQLRARGYQKPILLFTTKNSSADVINGFDAGADDYVTKPCEVSELLARIRALLRRGDTALAPALLKWGDLQLNLVSAEVIYQTQTLSLTPKEYSLLELFLRNPQRIFDRSAIIERIWSIDDLPSEGAVTNLIKNLRQKLRAAGMLTDMLETVYGLGYRLKTPFSLAAPAQEPQTKAVQAPEQQKGETPNGNDRQQGLASVNKVLDQFREVFIQRVASLEQAEQALQTGGLSQTLRQSACEDAHKLAGGLGMFGYEEGSRLARAIEHLLIGDRPLDPPEVANLSQQVLLLQQELARPPKTLTTLTKELLLPIKTRLVLALSHDVAFTESLQTEAVTWGCQVEIVSYADVEQTIAQTLPDIVLLDQETILLEQKTVLLEQETVLLDQEAEATAPLLKILTERFPALPILIITASESLDRAPGAYFDRERQKVLQKPMAAAQIFEAIIQLSAGEAAKEAVPNNATGGVVQDIAKVMIVDDDPVILETLEALLQLQGFQVTVLENPQQFWDVLRAIAPDLLLLDLEMPLLRGIDLCREVRQDPTWKNLPILVVTAHTDILSLRQVFAAGANDFISKPIVESELITRVLNQLAPVLPDRP